MTDDYIREGDIVEIDYITEFAKEHINEGKALVIWKGFNNQPLVRKLDTKTTIWSCYEHISKVVGHIDIEGYMDRALSAEPCEDCISRQEVINCVTSNEFRYKIVEDIKILPSVTPKEKTGHWIVDIKDMDYCFCSECKHRFDVDHLKFSWDKYVFPPHCPNCGAKMIEPQESKKVNCKSTKCENCINHNYCDFEPQESEVSK